MRKVPRRKGRTSQPTEKRLSLTQAAERLGLKRIETVHVMISRRELRSEIIAGRVLVNADDVERLARSKRTRATA